MDLLMAGRELTARGYFIWPRFIDETEVRALRADLLALSTSGLFRDATVGRARLERSDIRRDRIFWLEPDQMRESLARELGALKTHFNRELILGLRDFEGHFAIYPEGGFYQRHRDSFKTSDKRVLSFVLYLNQDWREEHGGKLRLYRESGDVDVEPCGGTLVCFLAKECEHEVLPSHAPRFSFTGWFLS